MASLEQYAYENLVPASVVRSTLVEWTALLREWRGWPELLTLVEVATARLDERGESMTLDEVRGLLFPVIDGIRERVTEIEKREEIAHVLIANFG